MRAVARSEDPAAPAPGALETMLVRVDRSDREAFDSLCTVVAGPVLGMVRRVLRDPAQSEEVAQEVLVEVRRAAARFDPRRGGAAGRGPARHGRGGRDRGARRRIGCSLSGDPVMLVPFGG